MKLETYSKNELVLMLELAGFDTVQISGDYDDEPATADSINLIFLATK
jgi:hypothetical protein